MKILKHGKNYSNNKIITCGLCHCKFEYTDEDVKLQGYETYTFTTYPPIIEYYIDCPECKSKVYVSTTYPDIKQLIQNVEDQFNEYRNLS